LNRKYLIGCLLSILAIGGLVILIILFARFQVDQSPWIKETSPLSSSTIVDLCKKLTLDTTKNNICDLKKTVYADEFFLIIEKALPKDKATFADVNSKLSAYESKREPITEDDDGFRYYAIWYDLKGDGVTAIIFYGS
jgi:hypothetical protein